MFVRREAAETDWIFPSAEGTPREPNNVSSRVIALAARAAGVPWATAHDLRHTFVTRCIVAGVNPKQIQVIVGHASIGLTMDTYGHLFDEHLPDALPEIEPDEPVLFDVDAVGAE